MPGVADVVCFGGFLRELHVQVDPSWLLAHDLTLADVTEALEHSNRNVGGGFLRHTGQQISFVQGLEHSGKMLNLTRALVAHGYADDAIRKILGANLLRLMEEVMGGM